MLRRNESDVLGLWASGHRLFGATHAGLLVAATVAIAVTAASIAALPVEGVRVYRTGGAQVYAGSIRMNERLGYAIEERWLSSQ